MFIKRYKIITLNRNIRDRLIGDDKPFEWIVAANGITGAWSKFRRQYFGGLPPNPADYDISLHSVD